MNYLVNLMCAAVLGGAVQAPAAAPSDATDLLNEVAAAYQNADALTDQVRIEVRSSGGTDVISIDLALSGQDEGWLHMQGFTFLGAGGSFYITRDTLPNKYIRKPIEGGFVPTLLKETNAGLPVPHFALRAGESTEQYIDGFSLGNLDDLSLEGVEDVSRDGTAMKALRFSSPRGTVSALVDAETKLIKGMEFSSGPLNVDISLEPRTHDELPDAIAFDPGSRREVDVLRLEVGDPAPDFELPNLDGETVRLSDLRGNMVVLDFWATWCGPCMRGLPELDRFAKWAASSDKPIRVLAVDSFERVANDEQKKALIERVWEAKGFSFPTLIDYTKEVAMLYEVGPIPHSVIIGPEGRIHAVHVGFDPGMFEKLKKEAAETLEHAG